jgi:hypothetical protein
MSLVLREPSIRNYDRWPILGMYVWPNHYIGDTYQEEVNYLKQWVNGRLLWMDENMPGDCLPGTGTIDLADNTLSLVPNPATTSFKLKVDKAYTYPFVVVIYNGNGITCKIQSGVGANEEIDCSSLSPGVYVVAISSNGGSIQHEKLVITQ